MWKTFNAKCGRMWKNNAKFRDVKGNAKLCFRMRDAMAQICNYDIWSYTHSSVTGKLARKELAISIGNTVSGHYCHSRHWCVVGWHSLAFFTSGNPNVCFQRLVQSMYYSVSVWKLVNRIRWLETSRHWCVVGWHWNHIPGRMHLVPASGYPNCEYCCLCTCIIPHPWCVRSDHHFWMVVRIWKSIGAGMEN